MDDVTELLRNLSACQSLVRSVAPFDVRIRLHTTGFEVLADCDLNGRRLSDEMNQSMSDYLQCANAHFYRRGQLVDTIPNVKIRKPEILIAGIVGDQHEAREKRIGSRRALQVFHTVVAIDRWIIKGRLHLTTHKTVTEFLHANRDFFPIAAASVVDSDCPDAPQQMNVAIVNRARVSVMDITELPESEQADWDRTAIERLLHSEA